MELKTFIATGSTTPMGLAIHPLSFGSVRTTNTQSNLYQTSLFNCCNLGKISLKKNDVFAVCDFSYSILLPIG
jgi:hypothetical protein